MALRGFSNNRSPDVKWQNIPSTVLGPRIHRFAGFVDVIPDVIKAPKDSDMDKLFNSACNASSVDSWVIPPTIDANLFKHIVCFKEKLLAWEHCMKPGKKVWMPPLEVAKRSFRYKHEFAAYAKDVLEASMRSKLQGTELSSDEMYIMADDNAWGEDYFFPPRDLPNFPIPEKLDDYALLRKTSPELDPEICNTLKDYMSRFIRNRHHKSDLDDLDMLSFFGGKSSYLPKCQSTTSCYEANIGKQFSRNFRGPLHFKTAWVQKNAAEGRAAVVADSETLYKIRWLHKSFREHVRVPGDMFYDPEVYRKTEKLLVNHNLKHVYLMSDIQKSGLTFNTRIHNLWMDVLYEETKDDRFLYFKDYAGAKLYHSSSGDEYPINNGYGLGMLDCIISATQALIYQIFTDEIEDLMKSSKAKAFFWSDDSIIRITPSDHVDVTSELYDEYLSGWNACLTKYGIIIHKKKPFWSQTGVFLELYTYRPRIWDSTKGMQYNCAILSALLCPDIYSAKSHVAAVTASCSEEVAHWKSEMVSRVVDHWGYEFDPEETYLPFEVGGWEYYIEDGLNMLIPTINDIWLSKENLITKAAGLLEFHERHRRNLFLHKRNEGWIQEVLDMGPKEDPTALSWEKVADVVLHYDYKSSSDFSFIQRRNLRKRQALWNRKINPRSNEILALTENFSAKVKGLGWYMPSESHFNLKPYLSKDENVDLEAYRQLPAQRFPWKAYLTLTREMELSNINIVSPVSPKKYKHISEGKHRLIQFFGTGKPISKYEVIYTIVRGVTPAWFLDKAGKAGWPPYLERLTPEEENWGHEILKFFTEGDMSDHMFFHRIYGVLSIRNIHIPEAAIVAYPEYSDEVYAVHSTATGGEGVKHPLSIYEDFRAVWNPQAWIQAPIEQGKHEVPKEDIRPPEEMEDLTAYIRYQIDGFIAQRDLWITAREGMDLDTGQALNPLPYEELELEGEGYELDDDFSFAMFD